MFFTGADRSQGERELGPTLRSIFGTQLASVLAHDAVADPKAETGAIADLLGGEERLENPADDIIRNTGAVVRNLDMDVIAGAKRRDRQLGPGNVAHRIHGVVDQIDDHLVCLLYT